MPSVVLGLIVEGHYDAQFLSEILPRIIPERPIEILRTIEAGGSGQLTAKLPGYVKAMEFANAGNPVDRVIVVRDSNGKDPAAVEEMLRSKITGRGDRIPQGIVFHAVRRELETWLLADDKALTEVLNRAVHGARDPLEDVVDAKARLRGVLSSAGRPYTPDVCAEIARTLDLDVLRSRCPNFRVFEAKMLA